MGMDESGIEIFLRCKYLSGILRYYFIKYRESCLQEKINFRPYKQQRRIINFEQNIMKLQPINLLNPKNMMATLSKLNRIGPYQTYGMPLRTKLHYKENISRVP